ncbi:hypothetical protein predicted by Glimmer/Critica [Acetobacter senegalensis]|uniref:Uncharacterized protein n=1 Tax=Acetobacter senegalensis TaxID=446692 RepID=A0A0U5BBZ7_9PROT|nr:hypothetical protein predicted by Glimmer/Critica [Acetobacter senegalensis]
MECPGAVPDGSGIDPLAIERETGGRITHALWAGIAQRGPDPPLLHPPWFPSLTQTGIKNLDGCIISMQQICLYDILTDQICQRTQNGNGLTTLVDQG